MVPSDSFTPAGDRFNLSITGAADPTTMIALQRLRDGNSEWEGIALYGDFDLPISAAFPAEAGARFRMVLLANSSGAINFTLSDPD